MGVAIDDDPQSTPAPDGHVRNMDAATDKAPDSYRVGDRLGKFSVLGNPENELLLDIDDKHLDVRVSVLKTRLDGVQSYVVSTVVHVHNWLGHLYMAPVPTLRRDVQLMGEIVQQILLNRVIDAQTEAGIAQQTKLQSKAQLVPRATFGE